MVDPDSVKPNNKSEEILKIRSLENENEELFEKVLFQKQQYQEQINHLKI